MQARNTKEIQELLFHIKVLIREEMGCGFRFCCDITYFKHDITIACFMKYRRDWNLETYKVLQYISFYKIYSDHEFLALL